VVTKVLLEANSAARRNTYKELRQHATEIRKELKEEKNSHAEERHPWAKELQVKWGAGKYATDPLHSDSPPNSPPAKQPPAWAPPKPTKSQLFSHDSYEDVQARLLAEMTAPRLDQLVGDNLTELEKAIAAQTANEDGFQRYPWKAELQQKYETVNHYLGPRY